MIDNKKAGAPPVNINVELEAITPRLANIQLEDSETKSKMAAKMAAGEEELGQGGYRINGAT